MAFNLRNRSFLKEIDFEPRELRYLLQLSEALKIAKYAGTEGRRLEGKEIALIFEKTSTRTRSAFEVASYDEGAHVTYLDPSGALMGSDVRLGGPKDLQPPKDVVDLAHQVAERTGARITITDDPGEAVHGV